MPHLPGDPQGLRCERRGWRPCWAGSQAGTRLMYRRRDIPPQYIVRFRRRWRREAHRSMDLRSCLPQRRFRFPLPFVNSGSHHHSDRTQPPECLHHPIMSNRDLLHYDQHPFSYGIDQHKGPVSRNLYVFNHGMRCLLLKGCLSCNMLKCLRSIQAHDVDACSPTAVKRLPPNLH